MMGNNMFGASAHEYVWIVCDDEQGDLHYYVGQHGKLRAKLNQLKSRPVYMEKERKEKRKKKKMKVNGLGR